MEQSGVKASGEKRGRSERSENITEREKNNAKREKKIVVRRSERRVRKVVRSKQCSIEQCRARRISDPRM